MGVDGAAHEGGLAGPGSTVAFVGTGLDRVYPARHAGLMARIAEHGLVASEYLLGTEAMAGNFPRRNRLIAGISHGTLVVEAAVESGSLITARMALECGRDVFAIPGSIHSPQSRGCHRLIQEGAKLVETGEDVLQELRGLRAAATRRATLSPAQPSLFATGHAGGADAAEGRPGRGVEGGARPRSGDVRRAVGAHRHVVRPAGGEAARARTRRRSAAPARRPAAASRTA